MSFDCFIRSSWNYKQMLALSAFGDAVTDFWPTALALMDQDPEDLSIPVNDVLSGMQARRLYRSRIDDINFNLVAGGEIALLILHITQDSLIHPTAIFQCSSVSVLLGPCSLALTCVLRHKV